jgi:N-glycosylase/DNA lyase
VVQRYRNIETLVEGFQRHRGAIRKRLREFAAVSTDDYFLELVYCLLTPQSSAVNAGKAIRALQQAGFPGRMDGLADILGDRNHYIRFHHTKARWLQEAWSRYPNIRQKLTGNSSPYEIREWLVENVKGLGYKEASHLLRNIGARDLAILDRHILKNLKAHGVVRALPRTLTPRQYKAIETRFRRFAGAIGISMDELDLLFWSRETGEILK